MDPLFSLCLAGASLVTPDRAWSVWSFAPATLGPLLAVTAGYGAVVLARRAETQRAALWRDAGLFMAGILMLAVAWVSPLCRIATNTAWAHMLQHMILVALAPPLLVLGARRLGIPPWRPRLARLLRPLQQPAVAAAVYGGLIWLWHLPGPYQAALLDARAHLGMYATLLIAGIVFWKGILDSAYGSAERAGFSIIILLMTMIHTGLLGALLSFSPAPWYPLIAAGAAPWRLTPIQDQQLAGLIMWIPMGAVYLIAALLISARALVGLAARAPSTSLSSGNDL